MLGSILAWIVGAIAFSLLAAIANGAVILLVPFMLWWCLAILSAQVRRIRDAGGSPWWVAASFAANLVQGAIAIAVPALATVAAAAVGIIGIICFVYTVLPSRAAE